LVTYDDGGVRFESNGYCTFQSFSHRTPSCWF